MKRVLILLAALTLLLGGMGQARADYSFSFSYSDALNAGYGTLSGSPSGLGDGSVLITSGSLTLTSSADGTPKTTYDLIPTSSLSLYNAPTIYESPYGQWLIDDLVYPSNNAGSGVNPAGTTNPSYITSAGLLFGQGSTNINICTLGGANNYEIFKSVGTSGAIFGTAGGTFVLTAVPEPSGLAHLGLGVLCLAAGFALRRRTLALTAA